MPPHPGKVAWPGARLNRLFSARVGERAIVRVQNPIVLGPHSEPQPDLALLSPREDFYATAHPRPEDVFLIVEVADASVAVDREVKVRLYARAAVPEVWIVNLPEDQLEVFRDPGPEGYRDVRRLKRGERIAPGALPDLDVAVDEALG